MKNPTNILFFILLLSITACKKKSEVVIQAQNLNELTDGSHYAGMQYAVTESWTPYLETKTKVVESGVLDDNGRANFDLKIKGSRKYYLNIQEPDNVNYNDLVYHPLKHEKNNSINFNYATSGYINLPRVNSNCEGENDKFRFKYYYTNSTDIYIYTGYVDAEFNWRLDKYLEGCIDYSNAESYNERPSGNYTIEWMVERPSGTTYGSDTFTITEGDTTNYLIEY